MTAEFPKESILGDTHTLKRDGVKYDVYKLIHLCSEIPATEVSVASLNNERLEDSCWTDDYENRISPRELLNAYAECGSWESLLANHHEWSQHIKRLREADCSHPVLIFGGEVIDGMHRLIKAIIEKRESIPAKVITQLPKEAIYNKKPA